MLTDKIPMDDVRMFLGVPLRCKKYDLKDLTARKVAPSTFTIKRRSKQAVKDHLDKVITNLCTIHRPDAIDLYHFGPIAENNEYLRTDKDAVDMQVTVAIFITKGRDQFMLVRLDPKLSDCLRQVA